MIKTENQSDLEFLVNLNIKLHYTKVGYNWFLGEIEEDHYTAEKLTSQEYQMMIDIIERNNYLFSPINTAMGFSVGFQVSEIEHLTPGLEPKGKSLLKFKEDQLPEMYNFERISQDFMKPKNLERAKFIGIEIVNDRDKYEY